MRSQVAGIYIRVTLSSDCVFPNLWNIFNTPGNFSCTVNFLLLHLKYLLPSFSNSSACQAFILTHTFIHGYWDHFHCLCKNHTRGPLLISFPCATKGICGPLMSNAFSADTMLSLSVVTSFIFLVRFGTCLVFPCMAHKTFSVMAFMAPSANIFSMDGWIMTDI